MRPEKEMDRRPLVSVTEAANLAGLSKSVAYRLAAAGVLPRLVRFRGARLLVRRHVLEAWLAGAEDAGAGGSAPLDPPLAARGALAITGADGSNEVGAERWRRRS